MTEKFHRARLTTNAIRASFPTSRRVAATLIGIAAIVARFWGIRFGLPHTECRPDESRIINIALNIAGGDPDPHYFIYPTFYMYQLAALFRAVTFMTTAAGITLDRTEIIVIARSWTACLGVATLWPTYKLARRFANPTCGLIAMLILSVSLLHVRDSHFGTTDIPMTFLVMTSLLLIVESGQSWTCVAVSGFVSGLAMATKYTAALLLAAAIAFEAVQLLRRRQDARTAAARFTILVLAMATGFAIASPFAIINWRSFLSAAHYLGAYESAGHQHGGLLLRETAPFWRYVTFLLPASVGWPVFVSGVIGLGVAAVRTPERGLPCAAFFLTLLVATSRGSTVFVRYILPVVPLLCVGGALAADKFAAVVSRRYRSLVAVCVAAVLAGPIIGPVIRLDTLLGTKDNRIIAEDWIESHIEGGSIWQSGSSYGQVQFEKKDRFPEWKYVPEQSVFAVGGQPLTAQPDYILIQRSPLSLYSPIPESANAVLRAKYMLLQVFRTGLTAIDENDFDRADAFFLPLVSLQRVRRPGPEFEFYVRRQP